MYCSYTIYTRERGGGGGGEGGRGREREGEGGREGGREEGRKGGREGGREGGRGREVEGERVVHLQYFNDTFIGGINIHCLKNFAVLPSTQLPHDLIVVLVAVCV